MKLNEVAYSPDIIWITYGSNKFDPSKFKPIDYSRAWLNNKPSGGLWACPLESDEWNSWCRGEGFMTDKLKSHFMFKLSPDANIYAINDKEDLIKISTAKYPSDFFGDQKYIDYQKLLANGYDGIYVTKDAINSTSMTRVRGNGGYVAPLDAWDVESICVFNPNVIIPVNDSKVSNNVRLTESQLRKIIAKGIKSALNEMVAYQSGRRH